MPEWPVDCHVGSLGGTNLQNHYALARPLSTPSLVVAVGTGADQIVYLEEGDVVDLQLGKTWISSADASGRYQRVQRPVRTVLAHSGAAELGPYRHYMQKEIFEQPRALADTLEGVESISPELFGDGAHAVFKQVDRVLILACGTSFCAGSIARYWLEGIAGIPTTVEEPASTATEAACPTRERWSSPSPKAAKPPTPWRH